MIDIDGHHLSLEQVVRVARDKVTVAISSAGKENIERSRKNLEAILETGRPVYGINTGFGVFADRRIPQEDSARLSRNLILSHAVGTGEPLAEDVVRAAMLVRANTLTKGHSGVRFEVVNTLVEMLNRGVTPEVPSQGSLGSSGDLGPLSHLALVFTADENDLEEESGWAVYNGKRMTGKQAMQAAGIPRIILGPKEGLALNNGATFSAALGTLTVWDADHLVQVAEAALALSLEAMLGCPSAFDARLHAARGQRGQMEVAEHVRAITAGSTLVGSTTRVQDAYSCAALPRYRVLAGIRCGLCAA